MLCTEKAVNSSYSHGTTHSYINRHSEGVLSLAQIYESLI